MPLSMNSPIVADDIDEIKELKVGVVYLLVGHANDKVVLKYESANRTRLKTFNIAIKGVFPSARLKILAPGEVLALNQKLDEIEFKGSAWEEAGLPFDSGELTAARSLKPILAQHAVQPVVKMQALDNVTDLLGAMQMRMAPNADRSGVRMFTAALNASGGLENLGQLIAIDLFNCNPDRFDWNNGTGSRTFNTNTSFHLRYLTRPNNVFVAVTEGRPEIVPLDFIDYTTGFGDINQNLAQGEAFEEWPGRILVDRRRRNEFAEGVVHDLEAVLNPHKSRYSLRTKLSFGAVGRVESGMVRGARAIRAKLHLKYGNGVWPAGAADRYELLGQVR